MIHTLVSRFSVAIVIASMWTAAPKVLRAQQTQTDTRASGKVEPGRQDSRKIQSTVPAGDSVSTADIERAAEQLAIAVQAAVKKATEDPALKVAALKVATNAVTAAQVVISQQAATLQTVLDSLAREIAMATEKQQTKQKSH